MSKPASPTTIRMAPALRKRVVAYQKMRGLRFFSDALVELLEQGLTRHKVQTAKVYDPKAALHAALSALFPAWDGSTPRFVAPIALRPSGGVDPVDALLKESQSE